MRQTNVHRVRGACGCTMHLGNMRPIVESGKGCPVLYGGRARLSLSHYMRWVGESSGGRHAPAPALAVVGHVAAPDPSWAECWHVRLGGPGDTWRSRSHQGRSVPPAAGAEHPSSGDRWQHRTLPRAGGGSGAVGLVRWSPDSRSLAAQLLGA